MEPAAKHLISVGSMEGMSESYMSRPQSGEQDEVATGAAHNNVLQRMKLNNKVALITGGALLSSCCLSVPVSSICGRVRRHDLIDMTGDLMYYTAYTWQALQACKMTLFESH